MLNYRVLTAECETHKFVSGDGEIDKWFRKKSLRDHTSRKHVVTCVREDEDQKILGFYALSSVVEDAKALPEVNFFPFATSAYFPCLQLVYLAVDRPKQRQQYGTIIMAEIVRRFAEIGRYTGLPALIVTPLNDEAERFYLRLGFTRYPKAKRLVLPIQTALATIEQAKEELEAGL